MQAAPPPQRLIERRWFLLQLAVSAGILGLLWWQADPTAVIDALRTVQVRWLVLACLVEVGVLGLRAWRVAYAVGGPLGAGFGAALGVSVLNLVAPARAADVVAAALVGRVTGMGLVRALAAYGAVVIADMFVHAVWLLVALGIAGGIVDEVRRIQSISVVAIGLLGLGVAVAVSRRLFARGAGAPEGGPEGTSATAGGSLRQRIVEGVRHGLVSLTLVQLVAASVQLCLVILLFRLDLEAVDVSIERRWLAAALCQALGALGSFLMPAAMGAGTATAATVILPALGASPAQGVAFGVLLWFTAAVPDVVIGLPVFWRIRRLFPPT